MPSGRGNFHSQAGQGSKGLGAPGRDFAEGRETSVHFFSLKLLLQLRIISVRYLQVLRYPLPLDQSELELSRM